jgi:hypothetical protein
LPGRRATPGQIEQFWALVKNGLHPRRAAVLVGMSENWGWRTASGADSRGRTREKNEPPPAKRYEDLDGGVKDLLKPENFNDFCEKFLARQPAAWRLDAALLVVSAIVDKSEKTFFDINTPPGVGKSTLFTLDIPLWLVTGGGFEDPAVGRAIRVLLGHSTQTVAEHYVQRFRRILELRRPYYDKDQRRHAELVLTDEFGRFKPKTSEGEESVWTKQQFLVAQIEDVDLYEKEPTVQAASYKGEFLGERVDYFAWDDLATSKTSRTAEIADELNAWFEDEAETRLEPGGVGCLVGQRLSPIDLHAKRLAKTWVDEEGNVKPKYRHIVYPAHHELTCDADQPGGSHRQWDLANDGCVLDERRLPWREIQKLLNEPNFRTVYQQEDADPESVLVLPVWIEGGLDPFGYEAPGCWDRERDFNEFPPGIPKERLLSYATVDPAAGGWWAIEWWVTARNTSKNPRDWFRWLIWGRRAKLSAGGPAGFLDWDASEQVFVGQMEELQQRSADLDVPIRAWVMEANAAHRYLLQFDHFRRWRQKWFYTKVIPHQTQRNKNDPELGVEKLMKMAYRSGLKRLPRKPSTESLNYMKVKVRELTTWPASDTDDTVLTDWFGEINLETIVRLASTPIEHPGVRIDTKLPPYLRRQRREVFIRPELEDELV